MSLFCTRLSYLRYPAEAYNEDGRHPPASLFPPRPHPGNSRGGGDQARCQPDSG